MLMINSNFMKISCRPNQIGCRLHWARGPLSENSDGGMKKGGWSSKAPSLLSRSSCVTFWNHLGLSPSVK